MGEVPDWYPLIQAARFYQCTPWELLERPTYWLHIALAVLDAEHHAAEMLNQNT